MGDTQRKGGEKKIHHGVLKGATFSPSSIANFYEKNNSNQ